MMSPLHEAVLSCSTDVVERWITRSQKDERNFLGQTPLHLAVLKPHHLASLMRFGHKVDAVDNYGITPLMYAAAMNQEESLMKLLEAGARPDIKDTRFGRTFLHYAAIRNHWNLMIPVLDKIGTLVGQECSRSYAKFVVCLYLIGLPDYFGKRCLSLEQLLQRCGSVNFLVNDRDSKDSTLLHYARTAADVDALLNHGFNLVNHENSEGKSPLISALSRPGQCDFIERLLDVGAEINHRDHFSLTALHYVLGQVRGSDGSTARTALKNASVLVARGADCTVTDNCSCSCSPDGCLPTAGLDHSVCGRFWTTRIPVWSLEWLSTLLDQRGESEAKLVLLSFIRRSKHEDMDMKHVCQHSNSDYPFSCRHRGLSEDDIDEILDEESEFINNLEVEVGQCSNEKYETLLDDWIHQIKAAFDKVCKQEGDKNAKRVKEESTAMVLRSRSC